MYGSHFCALARRFKFESFTTYVWLILRGAYAKFHPLRSLLSTSGPIPCFAHWTSNGALNWSSYRCLELSGFFRSERHSLSLLFDGPCAIPRSCETKVWRSMTVITITMRNVERMNFSSWLVNLTSESSSRLLRVFLLLFLTLILGVFMTRNLYWLLRATGDA